MELWDTVKALRAWFASNQDASNYENIDNLKAFICTLNDRLKSDQDSGVGNQVGKFIPILKL